MQKYGNSEEKPNLHANRLDKIVFNGIFVKIDAIMSDAIVCPKCSSEFTYEQDHLQVCSQCFYEWDPAEVGSEGKILDSNGNELQNGDSVVVIKDLPVKGAPKPVKAGTKVKNIRLNFDSDHNIDCKIDGFGSMALKSEFVKKA